MTEDSIIIYVYGRVQGVGFRYHTYRWAKKNKLVGYVRNMNDGSVKIVACGNDAQIKMLIHWLEQGGPPRAKIEHFQSQFCGVEEMNDFSIRH